MGGIKIKPMEPELLAACLDVRRKEQAKQYVEDRKRRHPWISLTEAAIELDVSQGRISQLISGGTLTSRRHPDRPGQKQVLGADVYAYKPTPIKKTRTKK